MASRNDVKPATKEVWRQGKLGLIQHFGPSAKVAKITEGSAQQYKVDLLSSVVGRNPDGSDRTMAEATVKKRLDFARQVLGYAMKHERISKNPFANVKASGSAAAVHAEVTRKMFDEVLGQCPNQDWRLILALCRFGGMRCPSEVLSLRWGDIQWDRSTMLVTSPKTEHHRGHESRITPLFPELRTELDSAYAVASEGDLYVVNEKYRKSAQGPAGWRNVNLRTQFEKIIWRSGLQPWPYLFHSMRSSRATELLDEFPIHVVARWMGMSVAILARHYAKVRDRHLQKATQSDAHLLARATESDARDSTPESNDASIQGSNELSSGCKSDARKNSKVT